MSNTENLPPVPTRQPEMQNQPSETAAQQFAVGHSGNLEGNMREISLDGAQKIEPGVQAPNTVYAGFETRPPETQERVLMDQAKAAVRDSHTTQVPAQQQPEHASFMEWVRAHKTASGIAGGVAGLAVFLVAQAGMNPGTKGSDRAENLPPQPTTSASAPVTPGQQETTAPAIKPSSVETTPAAASEYSLDSLKSMSPEAFNQLSNAQKGPYIKFLLSETDKHFEWFIGPNKQMYKFNPLDVASEANTPEQIINQQWFQGELAFAQPLNNVVGDFTLNKDVAKKALSAQFYDTTSDHTLPLYQERLREIDAGIKAITLAETATDIKLVTGLTDSVDENGKPIQTETISVVDAGVRHTYQMVYDKLDDKTSIWKLYKELPNK